jgi:hypothetical protein
LTDTTDRLSALPPELFGEVLAFADTPFLLVLTQVCRAFRAHFQPKPGGVGALHPQFFRCLRDSESAAVRTCNGVFKQWRDDPAARHHIQVAGLRRSGKTWTCTHLAINLLMALPGVKILYSTPGRRMTSRVTELVSRALRGPSFKRRSVEALELTNGAAFDTRSALHGSDVGDGEGATLHIIDEVDAAILVTEPLPALPSLAHIVLQAGAPSHMRIPQLGRVLHTIDLNESKEG